MDLSTSNEETRNDYYQKILVVSFNCFLSSSANGRTLQNLFYGWDKNCLAQLYMSNEVPDYPGCEQYYRITDSEALKALFGKKVGKSINPKNAHTDSTGRVYNTLKTNRQNQAIRFFRQLVWETNRWQRKNFWKWIDEYQPDAILLFSGNNAFIDKVAWKIAKRKSIPIFLYNCEDYYLKGPKNKSLFARINKRHNDKAFEHTMSVINGAVYNSDTIRAAYEAVFGEHKSVVVYNPASDLICQMRGNVEKTNEIAYLGNIAVGRDSSLIEVARELKNYGLPFHIYGGISSEEVKDKLLNEENIVYHGKVSYEKCIEIMCGCRLLVHCESFLPENARDLRFAFSTKIADSLASGTCLLVYAPKGIALTDYLINTDSAIVATNKMELSDALKNALSDESAYASILKATKVAAANHDIKNSAFVFSTFLNEQLK